MSTRSFRCVALGLAVTLPATAAQPGDTMRGGRLFLQCRACHAVAAGAPSGVGPNLHGIVGAKAATLPGYAYSPALSASGLVWTTANLDAWLTRPTALVAGTKMAFPGIADPRQRQDVIAYLATLGTR